MRKRSERFHRAHGAKPRPNRMLSADTRWCPDCQRALPLGDFHLRRDRKSATRGHCKACSDKRTKAERVALKQQVFDHYGHACACCGEAEPEFMTIDHMAGGGNAHRREIGSAGLYRHLRARGFPPGFQTLCFNCNWSKGHHPSNTCPHQRLP